MNAVSNAVNIPVTVKIRSGWDDTNLNAVKMATVLEENRSEERRVGKECSEPWCAGQWAGLDT